MSSKYCNSYSFLYSLLHSLKHEVPTNVDFFVSSCSTEHLAIILHQVSHRFHSAMAKADVSTYARSRGLMGGRGGGSQAAGSGDHQVSSPLCKHEQPAKMVCVKKEGPNKGRMFYVCNNPRENQCKVYFNPETFVCLYSGTSL